MFTASPMQIGFDADATATVGFGFTLTEIAAVLVQLLFAPVTTNVALAEGLTLFVFVAGPAVQVYVPAPFAVNVILLPMHMNVLPDIVIVGIFTTLMVALLVPLQFPIFPCTTYT